MNDCYFMGNLGRDPVVKCTQTGKTYARFSIGCNEKWGDKEITNWLNPAAPPRSRSSQACSLREAVSFPGRGCSPRMTAHFDRRTQNALGRMV